MSALLAWFGLVPNLCQGPKALDLKAPEDAYAKVFRFFGCDPCGIDDRRAVCDDRRSVGSY